MTQPGTGASEALRTLMMGALSAAAAAALFVACGGEAVVESGVGGADGSSTTSTTSSTTVGVDCSHVAPSYWGCVSGPGGTCPTVDAPAAHQRIAEYLNVCDAMADPSCCGTSLVDVLCGPDETMIAEACCYSYLLDNLTCVGD